MTTMRMKEKKDRLNIWKRTQQGDMQESGRESLDGDGNSESGSSGDTVRQSRNDLTGPLLP